VGSEVLDLIAAVLTVMWVPSVAGCTYLWSVYLQARRLGGDQWLLQMLAIVSVPITVTVAYVSLGSYSRLVDRPLPPAFTIVASIVVVFGLSLVVPYAALRIYLATHGAAPAPEVPVTNGKVT